jgi:hypothetical protein
MNNFDVVKISLSYEKCMEKNKALITTIRIETNASMMQDLDRGPHQVVYDEFTNRKMKTLDDLREIMASSSRREAWIDILPKVILLHHSQREYWMSLYVCSY